MLQIKSFLVRSIANHTNELSWRTYQTGSHDSWDYTFQILRSESAEGPYESISPEFSDKYYFIDNQLPYRNDWRVLYYKLRVTDGASNYEDTGPEYLDSASSNLYALEIARSLREGLRYAAGTKLYVLPVRTFGKKCDCFDQVTGKRMKPMCEACFNVGFSGGYLTAIETYGQVGSYQKQSTLLPQKGTQVQMAATGIRLVNYPLVKENDVILEPQDNTRWRVVKVQPSKLAGTVISQIITAASIDHADMAYKIELEGMDVFQVVEPELLREHTTKF